MKIAGVRTVVVGNPWKNWIFVVVETDEGLIGVGEATGGSETQPRVAAIEEINTGLYAFDGTLLWQALSRVEPNNRQGQYYLTDCAEILMAEGHRVVASCSLDITEAMGVNTPEQLAEVETALSRT